MSRPRGHERRLLKDALREAKTRRDAAIGSKRFWAREAFIEETVNGHTLNPLYLQLLARATSDADRYAKAIEDLKVRLRG